MNEVNKTLYIPLYGKAYVSKKGVILHDPKAEHIWEREGFALKGKSKSKWLAYYIGMRSAVFDRWAQAEMSRCPDVIVLHIGCGMDSRAERVKNKTVPWYDIDFPDVIAERRRYYTETDTYHMLAADARTTAWIDTLPTGRAIVVMEDVSMYLTPEEMQRLLGALTAHFTSVAMLADCYTTLAAKASKYRNPINDVGVTTVCGMDDPRILEKETGLVFTREHDMTPPEMIAQIPNTGRWIFRRVFAGKMAKSLYRMYEYTSVNGS